MITQMSGRVQLVAAGAVAICVVAGGAVLAGQGAGTPQQETYTPPRTAWGDPDLQGTWPSTHMVGVPFERPAQFGTRRWLTDEEFEQRQRQAERQQELDFAEVDVENPSKEILAMGDVGGPVSPPPHWLERGEPSRQSSLVVDPPDGRLPPMTPEGKAHQENVKATYIRQTGFRTAADLGPYDRCISRGVVGSMMPVVYNNGNLIVQTPGYVVLVNEMIHESRIIPLDGRPHLPATMRSWMGDSRGRFEGNTLVVTTRNVNGETGAQGNGMMLLMSDRAEMTERFTPTGPDTLQYDVTVNDPATWTAPWTASFELRRDPEYVLFEYACHEGNMAMRNMLAASRADER
jgi:hypothetical protein